MKLQISDLDSVEEKITKMEVGEALMLENIRFYDGERNNDKKFAKELASLADTFLGNKEYGDTPEKMEKYFYHFALAAQINK